MAHKLVEGCAGCHVGTIGAACGPALPRAAMGRRGVVRDGIALGRSNDEEPWPGLRDAVVGGMEHLGAVVVASFADLSKQPLVCSAACSVLVRERVHVLEDEPAWLCFAEHPCVSLKQASAGI